MNGVGMTTACRSEGRVARSGGRTNRYELGCGNKQVLGATSKRWVLLQKSLRSKLVNQSP